MMRRGMQILFAVLMVLAVATSALAGRPGDGSGGPVFDDELQCNIVWLGGEKVCID